MRINVKAASLTGAIILGVGLFLVTWWIIFMEGPSDASTFIGRVYPGYTVTPLGSFLGLVYGAIDGAVFFGAGAWLYNRLARKVEKK